MKLKLVIVLFLKSPDNTFNEEIISGIDKIQKKLKSSRKDCFKLCEEIITKINKRNKLVRISDNSPSGLGNGTPI